MNEDREWILNNVEEVCVNTKDIDEICFGLEQLTIFATETIQTFATNMLKLQQENKELHNKIDKAIEFIKDNCIEQIPDMPKGCYREIASIGDLEQLLEILKDSDVDE